VHSAGSRDARPVAVQITDETGRPVEGASVTFRLPEEDPGGMFPKGMRTEVVTTGPDGSALVQGILWNRLPGAFQIRITAIKGQVRAGTVTSQYISNVPEGKSLHGGSSGRKWLVIAAVAAGAAAGLAAGMSKSPSTPATAAPTVPPPQIGAPTITLGKP
jgi:hypothetical protein